MPIRFCGPRLPAPAGACVVNVTSRSKDWGRKFSPFLLGPVGIWTGDISQNMENAWQYSKVYPRHVETGEFLSRDWLAWARSGWANPKAVRYPMGRGRKPEFSYWAGQRLSYVGARQVIYIPLYSLAVRKYAAKELKRLQLLSAEKTVYLWDFDVWDYKAQGLRLRDVVTRTGDGEKMGHAFVLGMMLRGLC